MHVVVEVRVAPLLAGGLYGVVLYGGGCMGCCIVNVGGG